MQKFLFKINEQHQNKRLDIVILELNPKLTRSQVQNLIDKKNITVNNKNVKKSYIVKLNDLINMIIPDPVNLNVKSENIPLDIFYEDDDIIVVNKPKGMVVHPAPGNYEKTLVNALMFYAKDSLSGINGVLRPGIVHRIDKNTSGLLIVAKNDFSHKKLAEQIKVHNFSREYESIVYGHLKTKINTINEPIGRNPKDRKKMAVTYKNSKEAITHYKVIKEYEKFSHLRLKLETGRTHQIRVHMSYIGHPIAGDDVYGPKKVIKELNGQCLHAKYLSFKHPRTNKKLEFESKLPDYFINFLKCIH